MTLKDHKKHASLVRPQTGNFGRNEWAIVGAPCVNIKLLANDVIQALSTEYKCAYVDASHNDEVVSLPGRLAAGACLEYVDQQNYHQFSYTSVSPFDIKQQFLAADAVFVNGNHHQANAQVVVIHPNKMASLQKRVDQLTNVQLILLAEGVDDVFEFIKEALPNWQAIPTYSLNNTEAIIAFFKTQLTANKPALKGLVLAGGKSLRMGQDKGALKWHGAEQRLHIADMLAEFCSEVCISCRAEQKAGINTSYNLLEDTFTDLGPYGAILSAFRHDPNSAWLVVACDLPLLDRQSLQHLTINRDASAFATAFKNEEQGFPEPLITIWEPKSYPRLLAWLAQGYSCPRKVLINSDIKLIQPLDEIALTNVNTPEEMKEIISHLEGSKIQP
ncbi:NTP transferase domain-containing protein [Mucilaginibacter auburnensis]|uniref:Probable molybdenum cofactor guanylyltransferase n=1 Tax=Mucilaginibacter auburnensis TaxID=1457233 RepID=A0A2H9VW18_9SPHI|nr:NTP transferase domain-containing protein [Mucilaginibacter auburnensis]PJJ84982.1 molybdopterin-guanine dinucleotide biosynthesis protein A [Mucilaginibacter auburnensis]